MPIKNSASMQYVPTPSAGRDVMAKKNRSLIDRVAANWQNQGGIDGLLNALSKDATRIGGKIEKGVSDVGATMRLPHGTKPEAYDAVTGAAINTMGLGYGPAVGRMAMGAKYNPAQMNIGVWQGGPNKYGPEGAAKSLDHIGKGEGAQAYGWGRYDAENPDVAKQYEANLSSDIEYIDGVKYDPVNNPNQEAASLLARALDRAKSNNDLDGELEALRDIAERGMSKDVKDLGRKALGLYQSGKRPTFETKSEGNLYKHDLPDADVERYLDWDKPLSEQPNHIRDVLESMKAAKTAAQKEFDELEKVYVNTIVKGSDAEINAINARRGELRKIINQSPDVDMNMTGADLYKRMENERIQVGADYSPPRGSQAASEALAKAGIPGLKYFDGNNRGMPFELKLSARGKPYDTEPILAHGSQVDDLVKEYKAKGYDVEVKEGTRNFVTWDQDVLNRMKLLERNGEEF